MPLNCQSVIILPLTQSEGAIIAGTNKAKSLNAAEITKLRSMAVFLDEYLSTRCCTNISGFSN